MNAARKHFSVAVAVAVCLGIGHGAFAADVDFTVGGGSTVSAYPYGGDTQTGLGIRTSIVAPPPAAFGLNLGDPAYCFDFFEIWTHEGTFETSNDGTHQVITATLDLSPSLAPIVFTGVTYASDSGGAHGVVEWDNGGLFQADTGTCTYTVQLNDATFNQGSGTGDGAEYGGKGNDGYDGMAVIQACVELGECGQENPDIPEPATMGLLGLGGVLVLVRRRKRLA